MRLTNRFCYVAAELRVCADNPTSTEQKARIKKFIYTYHWVLMFHVYIQLKCKIIIIINEYINMLTYAS